MMFTTHSAVQMISLKCLGNEMILPGYKTDISDLSVAYSKRQLHMLSDDAITVGAEMTSDFSSRKFPIFFFSSLMRMRLRMSLSKFQFLHAISDLFRSPPLLRQARFLIISTLEQPAIKSLSDALPCILVIKSRVLELRTKGYG